MLLKWDYCCRNDVVNATNEVALLEEGSLTKRNFTSNFLKIWNEAYDTADAIIDLLPFDKLGCEPFSPEEVVWATGMVASRSFGGDKDMVIYLLYLK